MTVVSEVPTDILVSDLSMTNRTDITHNNTIEGIVYGWNRVVLQPSILHSKIYRRIHKSVTRYRYFATGQPSL